MLLNQVRSGTIYSLRSLLGQGCRFSEGVWAASNDEI